MVSERWPSRTTSWPPAGRRPPGRQASSAVVQGDGSYALTPARWHPLPSSPPIPRNPGRRRAAAARSTDHHQLRFGGCCRRRRREGRWSLAIRPRATPPPSTPLAAGTLYVATTSDVTLVADGGLPLQGDVGFAWAMRSTFSSRRVGSSPSRWYSHSSIADSRTAASIRRLLCPASPLHTACSDEPDRSRGLPTGRGQVNGVCCSRTVERAWASPSIGRSSATGAQHWRAGNTSTGGWRSAQYGDGLRGNCGSTGGTSAAVGRLSLDLAASHREPTRARSPSRSPPSRDELPCDDDHTEAATATTAHGSATGGVLIARDSTRRRFAPYFLITDRLANNGFAERGDHRERAAVAASSAS